MTGANRVAHQVGSTIRRLRRGRGDTQSQVARLAGISRTALAAYERGRQLPTAADLARLLAALECSEERFSTCFGPFGEAEAIRRTGRL